MLEITEEDFFDYISLGHDIDDLPIEILPICIGGKVYDELNQIKNLLNQLSCGGFNQSSTEKASTVVLASQEEHDCHNEIITCEDLLKIINLSNV